MDSQKSFGLSEGSTIHSDDLTIDRAEGVFLWDNQGKKYLDLFSQTWSMPLGHNLSRVNQAVKEQIDRITHLRTAYSTESKTQLAKKIVELAPEGLTKVNFVLHGSLAVEGALKLAMNNYSDRYKILYLEDGFHGRSLATMGISWKIPDCKYASYFSHGVEVKKDLSEIERKMKEENPAAIILELIQGNAGCKILDKNLVQGIRKLCNRYDTTMIIDEVQTAFGCMGKMFLCEDYQVTPDILVFGKAIGGGYPLAGTIFKDKFSFQSGEHSFTFAHCPLSLAAGKAYLEELELFFKEHSIEPLSEMIKSYLRILEKDWPYLRDSRVMGMKGAVNVTDRRGNPDPKTTDLIVARMLEEGIIISNSRYRGMGNTLMMQPPLIITPEQLSSSFETLENILSEVYVGQ